MAERAKILDSVATVQAMSGWMSMKLYGSKTLWQKLPPKVAKAIGKRAMSN